MCVYSKSRQEAIKFKYKCLVLSFFFVSLFNRLFLSLFLSSFHPLFPSFLSFFFLSLFLLLFVYFSFFVIFSLLWNYAFIPSTLYFFITLSWFHGDFFSSTPVILNNFDLKWHLVVSSDFLKFPDGTSGEEPSCQYRKQKRHRFDPWVGKIPWRIPRIKKPGRLHGP